ncbi:Histidinol-phosphate aminotransferase 2 [Moraxella lacunata]|uniref:Histidinol-phosphate aminotransferase 2 n=1 Tax=Moraxella lacunata TaxID=477 RepID=A0A378QHW5_MORLA|nr:histidinol-phosphate transaminase [Moraxella lacunata]STZ00271.1 Histidinol-phosphate aminotransferase 2 [Moraxella lacunata]
MPACAKMSITPTITAFAPSKDTPLLLNFNENSLGMSPKAKKAILDSLDLSLRYPDSQREALVDELARVNGVNTNQLSIGNGSSENIQAFVQAIYTQALQNKQAFQLVVPDPTFNYAELHANALGAKVVKVPVNAKDFGFDIAKMQKVANDFDGVTLFYLCNPNNPTGTITPKNTLSHWVNNAPKNHYFLLDEAYGEYVANPNFESGLAFIKQGNPNVLVAKTFSKIYALAGLRIGYAIGSKELIELTERFMSLDNTNLSGAVASLASLQDTEFLEYSRLSNLRSRQIVETTLKELKLKYAESNGNFIFHEIKGDVKTYQERMKERHIFVGRAFPPIDGYNRLTLGTPEEMVAFVKVLKEFRKKGVGVTLTDRFLTSAQFLRPIFSFEKLSFDYLKKLNKMLVY